MYFKESISSRLNELCKLYDYTPNKLAELAGIAPSTLSDIMNNKVENPSALVIYKICKLLKIEIKDFYDSDYFKQDFED